MPCTSLCTTDSSTPFDKEGLQNSTRIKNARLILLLYVSSFSEPKKLHERHRTRKHPAAKHRRHPFTRIASTAGIPRQGCLKLLMLDILQLHQGLWPSERKLQGSPKSAPKCLQVQMWSPRFWAAPSAGRLRWELPLGSGLVLFGWAHWNFGSRVKTCFTARAIRRLSPSQSVKIQRTT